MKKQKIVVLGIIVNDKEQILVSQRSDPKIKDAHLKWDIPGGKNEWGESLDETVRREILEETGLEVDVLKMMPKCFSKKWDHRDYNLHVLTFCFICKYCNGKLDKSDHRIINLKWIEPAQALKLNLLPTTRFYIKLYKLTKPEFSSAKSSGGIVLNDKDQVLLVKQLTDTWSFPKGHVKKNENLLDAAKREILEETGLKELIYLGKIGEFKRYSTTINPEIKTVHIFSFKSRVNKLSPKDKDIVEAKWFSQEETLKHLKGENKRFFLNVIKKIK